MSLRFSIRAAPIACDGVHNSPLGSFCLPAKASLIGDCSLFPQKHSFCGSPELLSARTVAGQKYHCPDIKSSPASYLPCSAALIFLARIIFHHWKKDEVEAKTIVLSYPIALWNKLAYLFHTNLTAFKEYFFSAGRFFYGYNFFTLVNPYWPNLFNLVCGHSK